MKVCNVLSDATLHVKNMHVAHQQFRDVQWPCPLLTISIHGLFEFTINRACIFIQDSSDVWLGLHFDILTWQIEKIAYLRSNALGHSSCLGKGDI